MSRCISGCMINSKLTNYSLYTSKENEFFFVKLKLHTKKQKFSNYFFRLRVSDRPTPYGLKRLLDDLDSGSSSLPGKSSRKNREFSISRKKNIFFPGEEEFKFQEDEHCLQEPKSIGQRDRDLTEVDNRV